MKKLVDEVKKFARFCSLEGGGWDSASAVLAKFAMFARTRSSEDASWSIGIVTRAWRRVQSAKHVNTAGQVLSECLQRAWASSAR